MVVKASSIKKPKTKKTSKKSSTSIPPQSPVTENEAVKIRLKALKERFETYSVVSDGDLFSIFAGSTHLTQEQSHVRDLWVYRQVFVRRTPQVKVAELLGVNYGVVNDIVKRLRKNMQLDVQTLDLKGYAADQIAFTQMMTEMGFQMFSEAIDTKGKAQAMAMLIRAKELEYKFLTQMGVFDTDSARKATSEFVGEEDSSGDTGIASLVKRLRKNSPEVEDSDIIDADIEMISEIEG